MLQLTKIVEKLSVVVISKLYHGFKRNILQFILMGVETY